MMQKWQLLDIVTAITFNFFEFYLNFKKMFDFKKK